MRDCGSSSHGSEDEGGALCHLCLQPLTGQPVKVFKGLSFHNASCYAAVRCFRRIITDKQKLLAADTQMAADPAAWRKDVTPLIVKPGGHRKENVRAVVRARRVVEERFTEQSHVRDELLLTRPRFRAYMQFWEGFNTRTADAEFERLLDLQCFDPSSGVERVRIPDNERHRIVSGTTKRQQNIVEDILESDRDALDDDRRLLFLFWGKPGGVVCAWAWR